MLKEQKKNIFVLCIVAILGILLATPTPAATLDIEGIYMTSCKDHLDGTVYTDPWVFEVWVNLEEQGSLHHIDVTPFGRSPFTIYEDAGYWEYESPTDYSSLGDLRGDYPTENYTFEFLDSEDTLLDSVTLNYPELDEPLSPVDFTYPSPITVRRALTPSRHSPGL